LSRIGNVYIFLGPPGSGKGSLSHKCVSDLGWAQLSTGNLCREHIAKQTEIGKQIDFAIKSGSLVTDSLIVDMVEQGLEECFATRENVILDGFPRTVAQARSLERLLQGHLSFVKTNRVRLLIDDGAVVDRLNGRYICSNDKCQVVYSLLDGSALKPKRHMACDACSSPLIRRSDDHEASIRERLKAYHQHEDTLLDFYRMQGYMILELNAQRPLDVIFADFKGRLGLSGI
jgi:adenylate kinase